MDFVKKNFQYKTVEFGNFIDQVFLNKKNEKNENESEKNEKFYLRSLGKNVRKNVADLWENFPEISNDFKPPSCVPFCFPQKKEKEKDNQKKDENDNQKEEENHYFSSAFCISSEKIQLWTHFDVMDNVLCEIVGKKEIVLWEPSEVNHLYVQGSSSEVLNIENPDLNKYPKFAKTKKPYFCTLEPGQVLFIPSLWFHNVLSLEPCIAVNVFWKDPNAKLFYDKKDLYGNKDLIPASKAFEEINKVIHSLKELPEYYQEFYTKKIIDELKKKMI